MPPADVTRDALTGACFILASDLSGRLPIGEAGNDLKPRAIPLMRADDFSVTVRRYNLPAEFQANGRWTHCVATH